MTNLFKDKVVFVTGSTRGIGLAIAEKFSFNGAKIFLNGRDEKYFDSAKLRIPEASFIKGDLSNHETLLIASKELLKLTEKIDILVCNLGSGASVKPEKNIMKNG